MLFKTFLLWPLPEQQEIVCRVEDLYGFADRIEARLATSQKTGLSSPPRHAVWIYDWLKYDNKKTPKVPKGTEAG